MLRFVVCLLFILTTSIQAAVPQNLTKEQIQIFMELPAAQREQLAKKMGIDIGSMQNHMQSYERSKFENVEVVKPLTESVDLSNTANEVSDSLFSEEESEGFSKKGLFDKDLKPFGYDLFAGVPTTFAPVTEIPVPAEYIVGPGDVIKLQLYGKENRIVDMTVTRDGTIQMPDVGPVSVAGLSFIEVKRELSQLVKERYIGVESSISLGELRSMRVFVLGEARVPGSYTVSSLSTITNALYVSGGILESGSLRNVQLKRNGKLISTLDLYELLLAGDTSKDLRLLPGDVVFIPSVGKTVSVDGEVRRPAMYEIKSERNISQAIDLAGGLMPRANLSAVKMSRVKRGRNTEILDVDLTSAAPKNLGLENGDSIYVGSVNELAEGYVSISGDVVRPGNYAWHKGLRISDLLPSLRLDLNDSADLNYALLVREINEKREVSTTAVSLAQAISQPGSQYDLQLDELDSLIVFKAGEARLELLTPVNLKLEQQARPGEPQKIVSIAGEVRFPGEYPLPQNQSVENLIMAAGGLLDSAFTANAEVSRITKSEDGQVKTQIIPVNITDLLNKEDYFKFEGRDRIFIKRIPDYALRMTIRIEGEVLFPGEYTLTRGQALSDLLSRAGGLTDIAFPEGAVFTRKNLADLEAERLKDAQDRLQRDLASLQIEAANASGEVRSEDVSTLQGILEQVKSSKPLGRLVVDLKQIVEGNKAQDVVLQDGDTLYVPQISQSITVIGEVQFSTSHLYKHGLTVDDYIKLSGGETSEADGSRVYVVRANGSIWLPSNSGWFSSQQIDLSNGDTIVVPIDTDRLNSLQLWTNVSQIFYQIALGAAAVGSL
ncbi:hypothetical protein BTA51_07650 [Hahella sp. CCB-MM4]|uniref:SLBB domain-containing protein n=1 Tax=Hahella sp. (strain CCB-MM4) TaxID=1926491 RepID=UPI000BC8020E|nr:SLBB domain-containing protein [Hahella sp. CCB-MM4]OZG73680.1 hypothetical protein BTA51_07650 [Hahella sp. CCB-MM4]